MVGCCGNVKRSVLLASLLATTKIQTINSQSSHIERFDTYTKHEVSWYTYIMHYSYIEIAPRKETTVSFAN